jgi:hypothetical protein
VTVLDARTLGMIGSFLLLVIASCGLLLSVARRHDRP